jgi:hypothetical protein
MKILIIQFPCNDIHIVSGDHIPTILKLIDKHQETLSYTILYNGEVEKLNITLDNLHTIKI